MPASGTPRALRVTAPAKVNLALEVLGPRPDGYHEIDTVLATIDLADELRLRAHHELRVCLEGPLAAAIDAGDELCGRAARALAEAAGCEPRVSIELTKRIPVAAGLGGGSSDAAAVLRGLNVLWGLGWPVARLEAVAASLGADVPFFLHCGVARCTGRGELVQPLRDLRGLRLLVIVPPVGAPSGKTARRYAALEPRDRSNGEVSARLARRLKRGAPPATRDLVNAFEAVVERSDPDLVACYAQYTAAGAPALHLCGAGPAAFVLVRESARVAELRRDLEGEGAAVFEARSLPRERALAVTPLPDDARR